MWWHKPNPMVDQVISLIERYPLDWRMETHNFIHAGGMRIWIANGAWALKVDVPKVGRVFDEGKGCNATRHHKRLWATIQNWRTQGQTLDHYMLAAEEIAFERWKADLNAKTDAEIDRYRQVLIRS